MNKLRITLLLVCVSLIVMGVVSIATAGYLDTKYYTDIIVSNTSDTTRENTRILFTMRPSSLVELGAMQDDADDTYLLKGSTEYGHTALNMNAGTATWITKLDSLPAYSSKTLRMYMGYPNAGTRAQKWYSVGSDTVVCSDTDNLEAHASFATLSKLTIDGTPTSDQIIYSKVGSYDLRATTAGKLEWTIWSGTGAVVSDAPGTPVGAGEYTQLTVSGAATNWQAVSTAGDGSYVNKNGGAYATDTYSIAGYIPNGAKITSVDIIYRIDADGVAADDWAYPILYSEDQGLIVGIGVTIPDAFTTYSENVSWSGGTDMEIGIRLKPSSTNNNVKCSLLGAKIDYTAAGGSTTKTIDIVYGVEKTLTTSYSDPNIAITDGTQIDVGVTGGGPAFDNHESVHILEYEGETFYSKFSRGATILLELDFDPTRISGTQLLDKSAFGNDFNYSLAGMVSGLSASLGPLTSRDTYTSSSEETSEDTVSVDVPLVPDSWTSDSGEGQNLPAYELFEESSNSMGWRTGTFYGIMMVFTAMVLGVGALITTGSVLVGTMACGVALVAAAATGVLPMWIAALSVLMTLAYLVPSRSM